MQGSADTIPFDANSRMTCVDPRMNPDNSGCKSDYEDSDKDIRLVACTPVVMEV